jgi:hypothetical protein
VPSGLAVSLDVVGVMRARRFWGTDADVFRPERWLATTTENSDAEAMRMAAMKRALGTQWGWRPWDQERGSEMAAMWLGKVLIGVSFPL